MFNRTRNINRCFSYPHNPQIDWSICSGDIQMGWFQQWKNCGLRVCTCWHILVFIMSVCGVFFLSLVPCGTGIEEGKCNVHLRTMLAAASCRLLGTHYLSPYSPDLEPRNFHFCMSLMNHFEVKHLWHHDEMKAEVNQVCVWRLRFYFVPTHCQFVVCSGTSISAGLLIN